MRPGPLTVLACVVASAGIPAPYLEPDLYSNRLGVRTGCRISIPVMSGSLCRGISTGSVRFLRGAGIFGTKVCRRLQSTVYYSVSQQVVSARNGEPMPEALRTNSLQLRIPEPTLFEHYEVSGCRKITKKQKPHTQNFKTLNPKLVTLPGLSKL